MFNILGKGLSAHTMLAPCYVTIDRSVRRARWVNDTFDRLVRAARSDNTHWAGRKGWAGWVSLLSVTRNCG